MAGKFSNCLFNITVCIFIFNIFVLIIFCPPLIYANESGYSNSDWSGPVEFTTAYLIEDLNSNGIPDTEEVDNSVDFNPDGISDNYQPHIIKCVQVFDDSTYIGAEKTSSSAGEIETLEVIDPDTISDIVYRPEDLMFGLISYLFRANRPSDIIKLNIYFSAEVLSSDTFYKYDTINGSYDYSEHTTLNGNLQDAAKTISISLTLSFAW